MAQIKSFYEIAPHELRPTLRHFAPFENVRTIRYAWFKWFWMGDSENADYRILIGPFKSKRKAKRAWDRVPPLPAGGKLDMPPGFSRGTSRRLRNHQ